MARAPQRREVDDPDLPLELEPLSGPELRTGTRWEAVRVGTDLTASDVAYDVVLKECVVEGVDLRGTRLPGLRCTDVRFEGCDLAGAVLEEADLTRVVFDRCRMTGAVISGATLQDVQLHDCTAGMLALRMTKATYLAVTDCTLREADLYEVHLDLSRIIRSDLTAADLTGAQVPGLDLTGSTLDELVGASGLRGAVITGEQLFGLAGALATELGITVTP